MPLVFCGGGSVHTSALPRGNSFPHGRTLWLLGVPFKSHTTTTWNGRSNFLRPIVPEIHFFYGSLSIHNDKYALIISISNKMFLFDKRSFSLKGSFVIVSFVGLFFNIFCFSIKSERKIKLKRKRDDYLSYFETDRNRSVADVFQPGSRINFTLFERRYYLRSLIFPFTFGYLCTLL